MLRRQCLHHIIDAIQSRSPFRTVGTHSTCSAPPALRVTGINTRNGVWGRGRGSGAVTGREQISDAFIPFLRHC